MLKYLLSLTTIVLFSSAGFSQFPIREIIDSTATGITKIETADINNDGYRDIVVSQKYSQNNKVAFYLNNGDQTFDTSQVIGNNINYPLGVSVGDFNADGWDDVVTFSGNSNNGKIYVFMNNSGVFAAPVVIDTGLLYLADIKVADMDNDNDVDIVAISDIGLYVYSNNGNGTYTKTHVAPGIITEYYMLAIRDIDSDGFNDVVVGGIRTLLYMNNNGVLSFDSARTYSIDEISLVLLVGISDLDSDGDADLIIGGNNQRNLKWFENDGSGFFSFREIIETDASKCESVATCDFDFDGDQDIYTAYPQSGKVVWYENDGSGNFGTENIIHTGSIPFTTQVFADDFNNNGAPDVIWAAELSVHFNQLSVGITEQRAVTGFDIYPNPSTENVHIVSPVNGTMTVYTSVGKVVLSHLNISKGDNMLHLNLSSQVYFLQIKSDSEVFYQKLMVE